jgi:hypothetical protein
MSSDYKDLPVMKESGYYQNWTRTDRWRLRASKKRTSDSYWKEGPNVKKYLLDKIIYRQINKTKC